MTIAYAGYQLGSKVVMVMEYRTKETKVYDLDKGALDAYITGEYDEVDDTGIYCKVSGTGHACTDCIFWLVNGETNPEWSFAETDDFLIRFAAAAPMGSVTPGMVADEHSCTDENGQKAEDCECDTNNFSRSPCDICGNSDAGVRHAVTFWANAE